MSLQQRIKTGLLVIVWLVTPLISPVSWAQDDRILGRIPKGVYIDLNKEFYEALKNSGAGGTKTISNNPSVEYLKQIAVSTRFMVESNLRILEQQEKMIQLLEELNKKK